MTGESRDVGESPWLREHIRDIVDYPQPGVIFRDITPLLGHPAAFGRAIDDLVSRFSDARIDRIVGIESRGFILAAPVAYRLRAGFVPVRKAGQRARAARPAGGRAQHEHAPRPS